MGVKRTALAAALGLVLAGCGASRASSPRAASSTKVPSYVTEPFTPEQHLVEQGAHLVVLDGCSACHLTLSKPRVAPDFSSFAGHRVRLRNGRIAVVDERFLREGLRHPSSYAIKGYDPGPMLAALRRLRLNSQPRQVAALAAFIEQVGPETQ